MYPLTGEQEKAGAYEKGYCRDCGARIQPLGPRDRCEECHDKYSMYVASGYGTDEDVTSRIRNQQLGNCFYCGGLLDGDIICSECEHNSTESRWRRDQHMKGKAKLSSDHNPYHSIWDEVDQYPQYIFTPSYGEIAQRMAGKARYFLYKAKRGGPRGREYIYEAASYMRIANRLQNQANRIKELSK